MSETEEFEFRHRLEQEQALKPQRTGVYENLVKPAVLPTGGAVAGAAFGAGVGTPFGLTVPGGVVGGAVGSAFGEAANQMLGITEPSLKEIGNAFAVPAVIGGFSNAVRPIMKMMNPKEAARALNAVAGEEVAMRVKALEPSVTASALFKQATAQDAKIPLNHANHTIDLMLPDLKNVSDEVQKLNGQAISHLESLKKMIANNPDGLTPDRLQRELEGAGKIASSIKGNLGSGEGAVKKVFQSMMKDLDDAIDAGVPGSATLKVARDTFKKESVLRDIGEAIDSAIKNPQGQGEFVKFNASSVIKAIKKDDFYEQALSASERKEIEDILLMTNKVPALRPGAGQSFGSGQLANVAKNSAIGGAIGTAGGTYLGAPVAGGTIGAGVGAAAAPAAEFGRNMALALQMKTGRAVLRQMLTDSKGVATPEVMSVLGAYAAAVKQGQVHE